MNNTVLVESKLRQRLKLACALMCVFSLCFIAALICIAMIGKQNLNGQTNVVTGILNGVYEEGSNTLTLDDNKYYNVVWDDANNTIDLNDYKGKTITLIVTRDTFASSNPWALGIVIDGQTIVDYHKTLEDQTASNNEMKIVFIAVTAITCAATCGLFIWRFNIEPLVERELYKEFGEFLSLRQPTTPKRKITIIYVAAYCGILVALLITAVCLDPNSETISELSTAAKTVLWVLLGFAIAGFAGLFILKEWITRQEIDFYTDKLPFDFTDISHAPLRKNVKEQLQQEILKDRNEHPHTYADGGNGYDVTFDVNGVTLTVPYDNIEQPHLAQESMPDADAVFSETKTCDQQDAVADDKTDTTKLFLSYDELNFEAVAYYRKNARPMLIIIKSRLDPKPSFPDELVNDIHIAFDVNLFNTLNSFNVNVENLDYLLQNKKRLMQENCLAFSKKKAKNN